MSVHYVVEAWAAISDPWPSAFRKDGRERSEPLTFEEARARRNDIARWHKKPNGTDYPGRFDREPQIIKITTEETPL